ncbi:hypothetical protein SCG7086_DJ_00010, partial [Chlamydiales bacterium SCGC AG-110-P3]
SWLLKKAKASFRTPKTILCPSQSNVIFDYFRLQKWYPKMNHACFSMSLRVRNTGKQPPRSQGPQREALIGKADTRSLTLMVAMTF